MKKPDRKAWLFGGSAVCTNPPDAPNGSPWRLVLLGEPGVGKSIQANLLCSRLGACHLSTGDIFRAAGSSPDECRRTPEMQAALESMHKGELVPDDIVVALVAGRGRCLRCCGGFVLDGFPRTIEQAEAFEGLLEREKVVLDAVLNYELPTADIVVRLSGRRVCPKCHAVYHLTSHPPRHSGACDRCGEELELRKDDKPEAVRVRLQAYEERTHPLIEWYQKRGQLVKVPAYGTPDQIYARTWTCGRSVSAESVSARS